MTGVSLKIAIRLMKKHVLFAMVGNLGLAVGLAAAIIILLYINHERSYDRWNDQLPRVYRVGTAVSPEEVYVGTPYPLGNQIVHTCPEAHMVTRVIPSEELVISYNQNNFYEKQVIFADSTFFSVFPYRFIQGNAAQALRQPYSVVITDAVAKKIFGNTNVLGKTIELRRSRGAVPYTITGVIAKTGPSHLNFQYCLSYSNKDQDNWYRQFYITYLLLHKNARADGLLSKANRIYQEAYNKYLNAFDESDAATAQSFQPHLVLEAVPDIHLYPQAFQGNASHPVDDYAEGNAVPVMIFSLAGLLILLISCINYTNLAIARAIKRTREIGMRKMLGASRSMLVMQFLLETLLNTFAALLLSILLVQFLLPLFNTIFDVKLSLWNSSNVWENVVLFLQLMLLLVFVTLVTGIYPAMVLANFRTVTVLKGDVVRYIKGIKLRNALIVLQFVISVSFLIAMLVINSQVQYMHSNDPGFTADQVLALTPANSNLISPGRQGEKLVTLMNQVKAIAGVNQVSATNTYPGKPSLNVQDAWCEGDSAVLNFNHIYFGFFDMLGMQMKAGRDFSPLQQSDSVNSAILNEAAVEALKLKDPIGKRVKILLRDYQVIGVVKNYLNDGYTTSIQPTLYAIGAEDGLVGFDNLLVRVHAANNAAVVEKLQSLWKTVEPGFPLRYSWVSEDFARLLERYVRLQKACLVFSIISMLIAIAGLWAMASFVVQQRTSEAGIRKVFGASTLDLLALMNKDFIRLVLLSNIIAWPLAWWFSKEWLNNFAYRIDIPLLAFAGALGISALLTVCSVSMHVWKVTRTNVTRSLRFE